MRGTQVTLRVGRQGGHHAPDAKRAVIAGLQAPRGVAKRSAATIVAETGELSRFAHPRQLMGCGGAVSCERSGGPGTRRGAITMAGNAHPRRVAVEAAWACRHRPGVGVASRNRQEGLGEEVEEIAWKAQPRPHRRCGHQVSKGRTRQKAITAVAREMPGFIRAIGVHVEQREQTSASREPAARDTSGSEQQR